MPAYKDDQRGTWYAKFNYKDWDGEIKQKLKRGFKTKKEASQFEREFLSKQNSNNLSFKSLCELFLEDRKIRVKPTTLENYRNKIEYMYMPYFGNMRVSDFTPLTIRKWHTELAKKYSKGSINTAHSLLSTIFGYGVKYHGIGSNPASIEGALRSPEPDRGIHFWTEEQYHTFREQCDLMHQVLYDTLYYSGVRVGELLALTWEDVEDGNIDVNKNRVYADGKYIVQTPKSTASIRKIRMPDFWAREIREYKSHCYDTTGEIFPLMDKTNIRKYMQRRADKVGLPRISTHDLRHSHASLLINSGVPVNLISQRLGHRDASVTLKVYAHLFPNTEESFVKALDESYQNRISADNENSKSVDTQGV